MTVPSTPRLEHFSIALVDLGDGSTTPLAEQDIAAIDWWVTRGATGPKLESGNLEAPSGTEGSPSNVADAISWTTRQAVRITPYGDTTKEVWGLVVKYKEGYSENGRRDTIKVNLAPIEFLLHSRLVYDDGDKIQGANETPDDFAKKLVRKCALPGTALPDPDGNSRDWTWGTLAVEADSSECPGTIGTGYFEELSYLDEVIVALSDKFGFDWELVPTIAGGALTFTFNTKYPRGGTDRTSGVNRAIINDFGAAIPAASRHFDMVDLVNAVHSASLSGAQIDATSISTYGRWEAFGPSREDEGLAIDVTQGAAKEGAEFTIGVDLAKQWMADWDAGDLVVRANSRLGIAAENIIIEAVHATFVDKLLNIGIRWGEKEARITDKTKGGAHRPIRQVPTLVVPLAAPEFTFGAAHVEGEAWTAAPTDSVIALGIIADDKAVAYPNAAASNRWTLTGSNGITTSVGVDASIITISGSGLAPSNHSLLSATHGDTLAATVSVGSLVLGNATPKWSELVIGADNTFLKSDGTTAAWHGVGDGDMCYWQRDGTTLFQATVGDDVVIKSNVPANTIKLDATDGQSHFAGAMYIGDASTDAAQRLHMYAGGGAVWARWEGGSTTELGVDGDSIATWQTLSNNSMSIRPNSVETMHINSNGVYIVSGCKFILDDGIVGTGTYSFYIDPTATPPISYWAAGMRMQWEGTNYRMPTDAPAAGDALVIGTAAALNLLEWGTYSLRDDAGVAVAFSTGRVLPIIGDDVLTETVAIQVNQGGTLYDALQVRINTDAIWTTFEHAILSAGHTDALAAAVVAGDLIIGNATPKWSRLAKGTEDHVLTMGASLPAWAALPNMAALVQADEPSPMWIGQLWCSI